MDCINLKTIIDFDRLDISNVTDLSYFMCKCEALENIEGIRDLNGSKFKDISLMFYKCKNFEQFNTENWKLNKDVKNDLMFYGCKNYSEPIGIKIGIVNNDPELLDLFNNEHENEIINDYEEGENSLPVLINIQ